MHRITYEMIIKAVENDETINLVGKIDIEAIKKNSIESLYYLFPLIERVVLEIYKLLPLSDVEFYQQGTMRTIMEMINKDSNNYFPDNLISILQKYFADDGLRNKLFHVKDDIGTISIVQKELDFEEIKFALMQLISILRDTCSHYTIEKIGTIETFK